MWYCIGIKIFVLSKVLVIIWSTTTLSEIGRHRIHHASVADVAISPGDKYVVSAGGRDDESYIVWDLADSKVPLCGK